jgi:hypothetical protein
MAPALRAILDEMADDDALMAAFRRRRLVSQPVNNLQPMQTERTIRCKLP